MEIDNSFYDDDRKPKVLFIIFILLVLIGSLLFFYVKNDKNGYGAKIRDVFYEYFEDDSDYSIDLSKKNKYFKEDEYSFVKNTTSYQAKSRQDILNIIYTYMNMGVENFNIKCSYDECLNDYKDIYEDENILSSISDFVHPFNGYRKMNYSLHEPNDNIIEIYYGTAYSNKKIQKIEEEVDRLYDKLVDLEDTDYNNIKKVHDYLINNSKYDNQRADYDSSPYSSNTAYGPLFQNYAICSGYTEAMALFLDKMNIKNILVSTKDHTWNAVYLDDKWYHIDVTWDDPTTLDDEDVLTHDYFMIDTATLFELDKDEHNFDLEIHSELKDAA